MNLTARESDIVFAIMRDLSHGYPSRELRLRVGRRLLDLLGADYFASYVWDEAGGEFCDRAAVNMSDENLGSYEEYFQYHDPITPVLQRRRAATAVSEIMPRSRFERTEFFNDFLARDGLHYGVNYYAYSNGINIGDLRIWRGRHREDFGRRELAILDAIGPAFTNAMRLALMGETFAIANRNLLSAVDTAAAEAGLTRRESEICAAVLRGLSDKQIAEQFGISFTTVRTHLQHIFKKLGVSSRTQLPNRVLLH